MEKFYSVQIPYRGVIPVIMRRGPIASIELSASQISGLREDGVELLDPLNGKVFTADIDDAKIVEAPAEIPEVKAEEPAPGVEEPSTVETIPEAEPEKPSEEEPVDNVVVAEPEAEEVEEEEPANEGEFDFESIDGYASLSKNKQKAVRRKFREVLAKNKDVATAASEAAKLAASK